MSISDECICILLTGQCPPNFHIPLRLAFEPHSKWLEATVQSFALTNYFKTGPIYLLYRSKSNAPELELRFRSYKDRTETKVDARYRAEPNWRQYPLTVCSTQLIKFKKRFRVQQGDTQYHFLVKKTQRLKLVDDSKVFAISSYSQRNGVVTLSTTEKIKEIEGVFQVQNLHTEFDGYHVGHISCTYDAITIVFKERIFPKENTLATCATIRFAGTVERSTGFYEVHHVSDKSAAESYQEDRNASDSSEDESWDHTESTNPAVPIQSTFQHPVESLAAQQDQQWSSIPSPDTPPINRKNSRSNPEFRNNSQAIGNKFDYNQAAQNIVCSLISNPGTFDQFIFILAKKFDPVKLAIAFTEAEQEVHIKKERKNSGYQELRPYQEQAVEAVMRPGNFLLYAATGAGKTRIFIELARRILVSKQSGRVVVVVPKIALTSQHAKDFEQYLEAKDKHAVHTFCSGTLGNWMKKWQQCHVAIATADYISTRLYNNAISFKDIALLILDEAHETRGNNPYHRIMSMYATHIMQTKSSLPKVFGVTATPARGVSSDKTEANLNTLLETLQVPPHHLAIIPDDNEYILQTIPQATPEVVYIEGRTSDTQFIKFIAEFLRRQITELLPSHFTSQGLSDLNSQRPPCTYALLDDKNATGRFQQWKVSLIRKLNSINENAAIQRDVEDSLWAICTLQKSVDKCRDVGFEAALFDVCSKLQQKEAEFLRVINEMSEKRPMDTWLFLKLHSTFFGDPQIQMMNQTTSIAGPASPLECGKFPKFAKLVEIISCYADREQMHGIVFVRTRLGAEWIASALQQSALQNCFAFRKTVGRGTKNNSDKAAVDGMSQSQLREALEWFQQPGKKILVSTSVCEEGVNVASCELIIRYNVALTSTEYKQSLGRARKRNARFVNIIEKGSKECVQLRKTEDEVRQTKETLMRKPQAFHIR
eukprot:g8917.t1